MSVLKKPIITEKASTAMGNHIYTFLVDQNSNKVMIREAFIEKYNKKPVKINIINLPAKQVNIRGRAGVKSGLKKALVYLSNKDSIDIF